MYKSPLASMSDLGMTMSNVFLQIDINRCRSSNLGHSFNYFRKWILAIMLFDIKKMHKKKNCFECLIKYRFIFYYHNWCKIKYIKFGMIKEILLIRVIIRKIINIINITLKSKMCQLF